MQIALWASTPVSVRTRATGAPSGLVTTVVRPTGTWSSVASGPGAGVVGVVCGPPQAEWVLEYPCSRRRRARAPRSSTIPPGHGVSTPAWVPDDPAALDATVLDLGADSRESGSEEAVDEAVHRGESTTGCLWLTGADDRASVLTRLEVAERLRRRTPALVVVAGPEALREDFADVLADDRTHLVALREAGLWGTRTIADEFHTTATWRDAESPMFCGPQRVDVVW